MFSVDPPGVSDDELPGAALTEAGGEEPVICHPKHLAVLDALVAPGLQDGLSPRPRVPDAQRLVLGLASHQLALPLPGNALDLRHEVQSFSLFNINLYANIDV